MGPRRRVLRPHRWGLRPHGRSKNLSMGKTASGGVKTGGQGRPDDENEWTDEMDVRTVIFTQNRPL
jgi:hypothetical protein